MAEDLARPKPDDVPIVARRGSPPASRPKRPENRRDRLRTVRAARLFGRRPTAPEPGDLVADPGGLLVFLEGDGQLQLLLQPLDRADGSGLLDLAADRSGAWPAPGTRPGPPPGRSRRGRRGSPRSPRRSPPGRRAWSSRSRASAPGPGPCIIVTYGRYWSNCTLSRRSVGVLDDEGEEPEVPRRVAGHQVEPLEVEGGEVAVVILDALAHQLGAGVGVERVVVGPSRRGGPGLVVIQERLEAEGPRPSGRPVISIWIRPRSTRIWILSRPSTPGDDPDLELVGVVVPTVEDRADVLAQRRVSAARRIGPVRGTSGSGGSSIASLRRAAGRQWRRRATRRPGVGRRRAASRDGTDVDGRTQSSLPSWIIGSSSLVFRSTARTIVRSSTPSGLAATAGMIWRESGRLNRTVKVPSGRSWTGSPWSVTLALGSVAP